MIFGFSFRGRRGYDDVLPYLVQLMGYLLWVVQLRAKQLQQQAKLLLAADYLLKCFVCYLFQDYFPEMVFPLPYNETDFGRERLKGIC